MNETPISISCPECGESAMLISLPDLRYRCEACAAVWRRVSGGYIQVAPSVYLVPPAHDDPDADVMFFEPAGDDEETSK